MEINKLLSFFRNLIRCAAMLGLFMVAKDTKASDDSSGFQLKLHGLGFDYQLQINHLDISPQIWLIHYKQWRASADMHLLYYYNNSDRQKKMAVGAGASLRYQVHKNLFLGLVYQNLNIPVRDALDMSFYRAWKADILLGGGYMQTLSKRCTAQLGAYYTLNYRSYSAYESRIMVKAGAVWKIN